MVNSIIIIISASSKSKILVIAITVAVIVVILAAGWINKEAYSYSNNAPDFNLKTLDGKQEVSLESFKERVIGCFPNG